MFYIEMAELIIRIRNRYDYVKKMCRDYIVEFPDMLPSVDMDIRVTQEDIIKECESSNIEVYPDYCESICIYRKINNLLIHHNGFVMHAACVLMDGNVYAFCAKSGVGKSTHLGLWKRVYGDRARIINGDKPIIRYKEGRFMLYGTPWCGKEGWNINTSSPLKAICFIRRDSVNTIERMSNEQAVKYLIHQILLPKDRQEIVEYLNIIDAMLTSIPCYSLGCNMDEEAARIAYEGMNSKTD